MSIRSLFRLTARALLVFAVIAVLVLLCFRWLASAREDIPFGQALPTDGNLLKTEDGQIFLIESGEVQGTQVLFAHGTAAWSGLWRPTLQAVAKQGYHATAFDLPPFGWSEHPQDNDYSRARQAERIIALLETLGTRPVVVAHSVGAGPVAEAVLQRPDLVRGLVVVAGAIALGSHVAPKSLPLPLQNPLLREYATAATAANPYLTARFLRGFVHIKSAVTPQMVSMLQEPMARAGYTRAVSDWIPVLFQSETEAQSTRPEAWRALDLPVTFIWGLRIRPPLSGKARNLPLL